MLLSNNIIYCVTYRNLSTHMSSVTTNSTMNFKSHITYYNRKYYRTFDDHGFDQEDFYTSFKSIGATQIEMKQSS